MDQARYREFLDIVRSVRHDANNPLTAALGHIQLTLEDPEFSAEEARQTMKIVENELRRLADIIRRLNVIREPERADPSAGPPAA